MTTSRRAGPLTEWSRRSTTAGPVEDLGADLGPRARRGWVALVFGEAPVKLGGEFGRDGECLVRTVLGDGVPEVLDELQALGDAEAAQGFEVERGAGHATQSENGGGGPQAG